MKKEIIINLSKELNINPNQTLVVLKMLSEGNTIPFIARYRKEQTNGLDEEKISEIGKKYKYELELAERKETIITILEKNQVISEEIRNKIKKTNRKSELEAIYEPFKIGKKTKASEAEKLGLAPLAKRILEETNTNFNYLNETKKYLNENVPSIEFAIEQTKLIIAQMISTNIDLRKIVEKNIKKYGLIINKVKKGKKEKPESSKYRIYFETKISINRIKSYQIMAINRAVKEKIINLKIEYKVKPIEYDLNNKLFKIKGTGKIILESLKDSLERLILPSVETKVWKDLFNKAEKSSIEVFASSLEDVLLEPAVKGKNILSIDPGIVSGCKVAVIDKNSNVRGISTIFPFKPRNEIDKSKSIIENMVEKFQVDIIVIGNGTASRETEEIIASLIRNKRIRIKYAVVSEVGASIYSASKIAIEEFPDLTVEKRSAINIARKFQDPMNEIIKMDPKSIGIGQYQHDVNQKELKQSLDFKIEKAINLVGVNINTATKYILSHISGISKKVAENIVDYRKENGAFKNRKQIKKVKGLGPKAYEQAVGFLRIFNTNYWDRTQVHPDMYENAEKISSFLNIDLENIDKNILENIDLENLSFEINIDKYSLQIILDALLNPTKDIRDSKEGYLLREDVLKASDLKIGDILKGTIQNITDFGAFIYIGIKESVFIHWKQLKNEKENLSIGKVIEIELIGIELERKRISGKLV
ncbi:MAG: helix-hairpin-helix domain-containing protein [Mollicutes bacterium PWAP]|nr:helix-hairpin-helix domain-containing protein [Mollicutes bacterium PWAP]